MPARAHIRVAIRTRPTAAFDQDEIFIDPVNKIINVHHKANYDAVSNKQEDWGFRFNEVLHNSTQDQVYGTLCDF
jgi:kinesin family member 6/9